jgi:hypothetical protein
MTGPTLVVMAAGLGQRYGGWKQVDEVGPAGELIMDYSIYDALRAGFGQVWVVVNRDVEEDLSARWHHLRGRVRHVGQWLDDLPPGYQVPAGRVKPWGTAHAVLAARRLLDAPFAVVTADDLHAPTAWTSMAQFLTNPPPDNGLRHLAMAGYRVENTLSDFGAVARAVCRVDDEGHLMGLTERAQVVKHAGGARYLDDGQAVDLPAGSLVSMTLWGLTPGFLWMAWSGFADFLDHLPDPATSEYQLPTVVDAVVRGRAADVTVLPCDQHWYGVTYQADRARWRQALAERHQAGVYPTPLWGDHGS